jgi:phenylalanyl-tRNA synthetase beta subunit
VAFHVTYQSLEQTLISEEIQKLHSQIAGALAKKFQATFQSAS